MTLNTLGQFFFIVRQLTFLLPQATQRFTPLWPSQRKLQINSLNQVSGGTVTAPHTLLQPAWPLAFTACASSFWGCWVLPVLAGFLLELPPQLLFLFLPAIYINFLSQIKKKCNVFIVTSEATQWYIAWKIKLSQPALANVNTPTLLLSHFSPCS